MAAGMSMLSTAIGTRSKDGGRVCAPRPGCGVDVAASVLLGLQLVCEVLGLSWPLRLTTSHDVQSPGYP